MRASPSLRLVTSANLEAARRWADAFRERDIATMQALVTDDFVLIPIRAAMEDAVYEGKQGIADWVADLAESWSELDITVDEFTEPVPDTVLALGRVVARGHGSNVPVESGAGWVARMNGGLASSIHTYLDTDAAVRAATGES